MTDTPLLPCPFCGTDRAVVGYWERIDEISGWYVICDAAGFRGDPNKGCGASTGWNETREAAAADWNRRAPQ